MPHSGPSLLEPVRLAELLDVGLQRHSDEPALVSMERQWTWAQLDRITSGLAAHYLSLGLTPGDRVASLMPNRVPLLAHYLACFKAGLVATPLNYRYTPPEIDHALEVSEAAIIVAHAERKDDIAASKARDLRLGVVTYGESESSAPSLERFLEDEPPALTLPEVDSDAPAAIFFTSGSTGPAKGVTHTVDSLGWLFASAGAAFELTPEDTLLPGSSCSHIGGVAFSFAALSKGARVVVARAFDHDELGPLLRMTRPTVLSMLPTALLRLIREHDISKDDFSSLRLCRCGGDKVPAELEKEFVAMTGHPINEGYGMTEIGLATLNPPSGVVKFGSVGSPTPGFVVSVRSDNGEEVVRGQQGRLWVKTPTQTSGYWNNPEASDQVMKDGWLDTGDVMKADEDGYLWFCGRKKQIIVHDGSNICPQEVEEALLEHPAVENAGVIGVHDLLHGENVRAYVEIRADAAPPTARELIQFARERVGYKAPEEIVFLEEMPLNATGKVDRVTLKKLAADDHALHI